MPTSPTENQHADPPLDWVAVTKSDVTVYDPPLRGFRVGTTAGDVTVVTFRGNPVTFPSVQVGEFISGVFTKIMSTGTAAAGISGAY